MKTSLHPKKGLKAFQNHTVKATEKIKGGTDQQEIVIIDDTGAL